MKKGWTRDYWFLLGVWVLFTVLQILAVALSVRSQDLAPFFRFRDPIAGAEALGTALQILASACAALSGAAVGIVAIRHGIRPVLLVYLLILLFRVAPQWRSFPAGSLWLMGLSLLSLLVTGAVTFALAKGLYRLYRGRERAVALSLAAFAAAAELAVLLWRFFRAPAEVEPNLAAGLLRLLKDALLSAASYLLLYVCIRKWWDKPGLPAGETPAETRQIP